MGILDTHIAPREYFLENVVEYIKDESYLGGLDVIEYHRLLS